MKSPSTYLEWVHCFDLAKEGTHDEEVLSSIKNGSIDLTGGVGGRIASQLNDVIQVRLKRASDKFNRSLSFSGGDMNLLTNSLILFRKEFKFLIGLVQIPGMPESDVNMFIDVIKKQADLMQQSLETTSKSDRTGMLSSIIKRNRINNLGEI
ncbi:hypothetical protein CSC2_18680 [Clostridium zeae]|uniref:Uncharacterized protein n=1 Tax=Clostridium zeae TaxID=2759022 RepID=A0ABQ1E969_9CLOT|nr:hypothetical protein [Clostridium zeae]GFZ31342.1 hypothetical protein CSC2_18680 [Clostridium zeae]